MTKLLALLILSSCSLLNGDSSIYLLVHGEHFDERIFNALAREIGSKAYVVELPTTTKIGNVEDYYNKLSLNDYAQAVCQKIEAVGKPMILVAHGLGGATVNQAYGVCPEKINGIIYVGATIPFPGESAYKLFTAQDAEFYDKAIEEDKETGLTEVSDRFVFASTFAQDATNEDREMLIKMCRPEPTAPKKDKLKFNLRGYQSLNKLVVVLSADKVISPETQKKFFIRMENTEIKFLESDHLPMITKTEDLAEIVQEFGKDL